MDQVNRTRAGILAWFQRGLKTFPPTLEWHTQVESALRLLPGLANATVARSDPKGLSYYPADHAATLWYASSQLSKSIDVQTFDWDVTFEGLAGPQPLLQVRAIVSRKWCK